MKKRITKKGEFICRRQKSTDKSYSFMNSVRLSYFKVVGKPSYVIRKRKVNNVIYVGTERKEAMRMLRFFNGR